MTLGATLKGWLRKLRGLVAAPPGADRPDPVPVEPASFAWHTYKDGEGKRRYKVYVPSGGPPSGRPLVLMLHGCLQDADDFALGTRMNRLAELEGFVVAYPEQPKRVNPKRCWGWYEPANQRRGGGEPAILAAIAAETVARHGLDGGRVYAAGLSAGGAMAAILGQTHPDLFAAVGVHSGLPRGAAQGIAGALTAMRHGTPGASAPFGPVAPVISFHGEADEVVNPVNAVQVLRQFGAEALVAEAETGRAPAGRAYVRTRYRDAQGQTSCESWRVEGLGHAWTGGNPAGSFADAKGPDASEEMLRFFKEHARGPLAEAAGHASRPLTRGLSSFFLPVLT